MPSQITVKIPEAYRAKFNRKREQYDLGYTSFPEFIKDCLRRRFEELDQLHSEDEGVKSS
jgi:hypothetical protein